MVSSIQDPDVASLGTISQILRAEYRTEELEWNGSPFEWIKARPSRQVGSIGENLVARWLTNEKFDVARSPDSSADRLINGHRAEIKFSTLWRAGFYKFQQLRDQDYAFVICLGVGPSDAHCWIIPKSTLMERREQAIKLGREFEGIGPQHGGAAGRDTAWLTVNPLKPPIWLAKHGGRLPEAVTFLGEIARRHY